MPLTQEKRLENKFSNNNDHSYRHKKFKKMASTISVFPPNTPNLTETTYDVAQVACSTSITNGSIAEGHPEIEKIKENHVNDVELVERNVQTNFNESRLSNVNNTVQVTGHTSFTDEFSNKTENLENDFSRDPYNSGTSGRYICPYCKLSCAKPSVLQKHIRAHTNERPYPCVPCGFAFKTKSNLYKHRRSRTHALRLQGADVPVMINEDDLSGGSESDTSIPPPSISDASSDISMVHLENSPHNEFSSPELPSEVILSAGNTTLNLNDNSKSKTIYKPKFRAAFYQESEEKDKLKKSISQNADFLTEHISKIISDNEAIVDVIETPLQKKYGKIKQIAESKQFMMDNIDLKIDQSPLNLTKNNETENLFRKRSHSESFSITDNHKHPLNPEGSIIKDLLLKTKLNGLASVAGEVVDGLGPLFVCPLCQIMYRSADNLEVHRLYYCKGSVSNNVTGNSSYREAKIPRSENVYVRSNSVNVRLPETQSNSFQKLNNKSPPLRNKPDNLIIIKSETNDVIPPLISPGPLLGNTRLVDARASSDYIRISENFKIKPIASPKRRVDSRSDTYSPRLSENISPRSTDLYTQSKIRCIEANTTSLRTIEDMTHNLRHNSTSLQMFGGEVKIVDHLGSTTTLRIEPSKNQLSPILIHQNLSPSKIGSELEASSVVVRSGLHSGGTIVHNPPTPKETIGGSQPQTPRVSKTNTGVLSGVPNVHDITHFQFPPLSAITAFNPLTLPPLSPSSSPSGPSTILHGGKLIPHVPGIPGPNSPGAFIGNQAQSKSDNIKNTPQSIPEVATSPLLSNNNVQAGKLATASKFETLRLRSPMPSHVEYEKNSLDQQYNISTVPLIKIRNVDEPNSVKIFNSNVVKPSPCRPDISLKRNIEGQPRIQVLKENTNHQTNKSKIREKVMFSKNAESKSDSEVKNFNFENLITKTEIFNNQIQSSSEVQKNTNAQDTNAVSVNNERSETSYFQKNLTAKTTPEERRPKFLRPSTLPLKPGTFTPKRHHGITPTANTMPLVSPETPRPAKAYGQLYLNGNAYTYLGLKCSTKVFYCTINRTQPTYVPNQHFLSMYSNWQLFSDGPDPLGLSATSAMSLYDSRHRPQSVAVAVIKQELILTHSSQWNKNTKTNKQMVTSIDTRKTEDIKLQPSDSAATPKKELTGGFESNEEYTYVRGRGRGRYVCSECGIRCKKPSMLKKHIRTHTDVRPYTCIHCAFSFKTKGNLTKHMKSKAHYKKCCELGINPNEGQDMEGGEMLQSGETDDDTESDGDEGNEGETESSDTEIYKSRLPEHEAAHCLLSLGGPRPATSATPGLITSARPSTYPYTPTGIESRGLDVISENIPPVRCDSVDSKIDVENEPMDLSRNDMKCALNITEIPTARESSVLASLASNTAKLPQHHTQWSNGEPMLHTYLTERALLDSKIKQSQLTSNLSKLRKIDLERNMFKEKENNLESNTKGITSLKSSVAITTCTQSQINITTPKVSHVENGNIVKGLMVLKNENCVNMSESNNSPNLITDIKKTRITSNTNAENAKHVVSEYLKHARINLIKSQEDIVHKQSEKMSDDININNFMPEESKSDELVSETDSVKLSNLDHESVAPKVVIGAGGVAIKVTKGKEFESNSPYSPGRLMEDGRRVCDFCNKAFTKPSQLRLHLNIHYMERPFRCSVCAVSFRTKGHLQKHERSGSHHNKVSMTSTFGAATSFNPRPFRCSDCNIAFRIHGHLAKHLRSKMHVMRLECLFKLPFGTFTEIERAGLSLTDIDTTDCASSLASLQTLARKLHEKDPTKLEYREPSATSSLPPVGRESSEDEDSTMTSEKVYDSEKDSDIRTNENNECQERDTS